MATLNSLKSDVVNPTILLSTILLKAKIVAFYLENKEFKDWLEFELNGYPQANNSLPIYRHIPCNSLGNFVGPFGRELKNIVIPKSVLPEEMRIYASHLFLTEPISSFETNLNESDPDMGIAWPGDWVRKVYLNIFSGYSLMYAWKPVSNSTIRSVINSVRSRLLDFILILEAEFPEILEDKSFTQTNSEKVSSIVQNTFYGGSQVIAAGLNVDQTVVQIQGQTLDLPNLFEQLRAFGVPDDAIKELENAIELDGNRTKEEGYGEKVQSWLSRAIQKIGTGIWDITVETVPTIVAKFLANYYGW